MAHEYYTADDIELVETAFLGDVEKAISDARENLVAYEDYLEEANVELAAMKGAHLEAINFITDRTEDMIRNAFMEAIFASVEYNHELFIGRSLEAVGAHWQEVLFVIPGTPGNVTVETDFNAFGDIESYAAAVEQARNDLGFKMTTNATSRSIYWARNIYGVDREGRTVRVTPSGHKKSRDVTANYLGKWIKTILTRLKYVEAGKAPWWYLVNYGNVDGFEGSEGNPYPVVSPTYFVEVLETQILDIFKRIYNASLEGWSEWYTDHVEDDYGLKEFDDPREVLDAIEPKIVEQIQNQEPLKPTNVAIGLIRQDGKMWDLYIASGGQIRKRYSLSKN